MLAHEFGYTLNEIRELSLDEAMFLAEGLTCYYEKLAQKMKRRK